MTVTQISIGRFHHFHLARQMERHGLLKEIWTGYPSFKLRDEEGIPLAKIRTFPWLHTPYMLRGRVGLANKPWLEREWAWWAHETLDRRVAAEIRQPTTLVALSGTGLHAGARAQSLGGHYVCDRGSSHIRFQNHLLGEEYRRWGLTFPGIDPRVIAKEEAEYQLADRITVPSEFVRQSFLDMGVPAAKITKVVYGARLERFQKIADPPRHAFRLLWVGGVSIRKGFLDLVEAFQNLRHPGKELLVIGTMDPEVTGLLAGRRLKGITFRGVVPNQQLPLIYSSAHVFVLPSIEEGLAMVQGEALACGCPVVATVNSGCEDLFSDGVEGFIVPIRAPHVLRDRLQRLADDATLQQQMAEAAVRRVQVLGGWDTYGNRYAALVHELARRAG